MASPSKVPIERRHYVYFVLVALAVFTYTAALSALYEPGNQREFWKSFGLFLGPTLVAVGWVVTNEVNTQNSRKQHTINLIMQYFTNVQRIKDKETLNTQLPNPKKLLAADIDFDDPKNDLLRTVLRELNYLDFLASGVLHREIDEQMFRRVFVTIIPHYRFQFGDYIDHWRAKEPVYWADFITLHDKWNRESRDAQQGSWASRLAIACSYYRKR